jgi:ATP-binding cassette subfamily C (CFTR/MRP) protein 1
VVTYFQLPNVINQLVEATVAMQRIEKFLNAPDQQPTKILDDPTKLVEVKDAAFTYQNLNRSKKKNQSLKEELEHTEQELLLMKAMLSDAEDQLAKLEGRPNYKRYGTSRGSLSSMGEDDDDEVATAKFLSLRQLNFDCQAGEFIVVVGRVGSGKSTFLKALLGEIGKVTGEVKVRGKVAYFDQKPFIMNDTVKRNVLFGKPDDNEKLYNHAIAVSSMEHDLALLPHGDQCEIGERGITLSGGQKVRSMRDLITVMIRCGTHSIWALILQHRRELQWLAQYTMMPISLFLMTAFQPSTHMSVESSLINVL